MRKRIIAVLMLAAVCLPLCGCNLIDGNVKTMLRAPQPNNMQEQLTIAITETLGSNLTYVSPKNGKTNLRQPIILTDLDSDGKDEVVIFYRPENSAETGEAYIAVFKEQADGHWQQWKNIRGESGEIDYIDFWDFDGNNTNDLLVGWSRGESAPKVLTAYDLQPDSQSAPLFQETYTESRFFEERENRFIFILNIADKTAGTGSAKIMAVQDGTLKAVATCPVDGTGDGVQDIKYARINSRQYAVILDIKRGNNMSSQFLFWDETGLTNPYMRDGVLNSSLIRETEFACLDIDKDGIVDVPTSWSLPAYTNLSAQDGNKMLVLTDWSMLNIKASEPDSNLPALVHDFYCIMNSAYGYYYIVPTEWVGKVTCYQARDNSMHFYYVGSAGETEQAQHMFSIYQMTEEELANRMKLGNWYELRSEKDSENLFVINMSSNMSEEVQMMVGSVADSRKNWIQYK